MTKKTLLPIIALLLAGVFLAGCSFSLAEDITPPPGSQMPSVMPAEQVTAVTGPLYPLVAPNPASGQSIYAEKCAPCHGETGLGDGERAADLPNPVAPLGVPDLARSASPAQWYLVVTQGNLERFMPPFPSLTPRQVWDVIAFTYTLSDPHKSVNEGQDIFQATCAGCHGSDGKGQGEQAAGLEMIDFTDQEIMASKSAADLFQSISNGVAPAMPAYAEELSEDQRWTLTTYIRSLTFAADGQLAETESQAAVTAEDMLQPAIEPTEAITPTQVTGVISGLVENGSGGELPQDLEIMLHGFENQSLVITQTVTLDDSGTYTFSDIEMPHGMMFFTTLQHQGVTYGSDVGSLTPGQTSLDLPITIFDTTQDASGLKLDRLHLFFEQVDPQTMRVAELLVMSNTGSQTIVAPAAGQASFAFSLPSGFENLQFQDGEIGGRYLQTADGFADTTPIYPGVSSYQVLLAYTLPYQRSLELVQPMSVPADAVVILVPAENFKLKGENLAEAGTRDVDGVPYQQYQVENLQAGDQLRLTVSSSFSLASGAQSSLVIGLAALGLALVGGGAWMYVRSRKSDDEADGLEDGQAEPGENAQSPDDLMDAILALDDLFHAGRIDEATYLERRSVLKDRLKNQLGS